MSNVWIIALTSVLTALGTWGIPALLRYAKERDERSRTGRADTIEEWRRLYADTRAELARSREECEEDRARKDRKIEAEVARRRYVEAVLARHGIDLEPEPTSAIHPAPPPGPSPGTSPGGQT